MSFNKSIFDKQKQDARNVRLCDNPHMQAADPLIPN